MTEPIKLTKSLRQLMETTEHLILEKGCKKTTLQDIIRRSGLSKGAIYHYVRSKEELYGLILRNHSVNVDDSFFKQASKETAGLDEPLSAIVSHLDYLTDKDDVRNIIFIYLLGLKDNPVIIELLSNIYEASLKNAISWVETGQKAGVIKSELDPQSTAKMFMSFSYGLRVRGMLEEEDISHEINDFYNLMKNTLQT